MFWASYFCIGTARISEELTAIKLAAGTSVRAAVLKNEPTPSVQSEAKIQQKFEVFKLLFCY